MNKKVFLSGFLVTFIVGLSFLAAKLAPCQAMALHCPKLTDNSQTETPLSQISSAPILVDKKLPISDYTPERVAQSLAENKRVILFFQASWCSTCYLVEKDLETNASKIPNDVVISRVNIDVNKELKAKYDVVAQDEMVQIDKNGTKVSHWKSSQRATEELLSNLK